MIEISRKDYNGITFAQRNWLRLLEDITVRPPIITETWRDGKTPGVHFDARKYHWQFPYQYREMLINEIPYDLDVYDWEILKIALIPLLDYLDSEKIPYLMSGSGGNKSIHVQLFFEPNMACVLYGWRGVRIGLWNWLLDQANIPMTMRGNGKRPDGVNYPYDKSCCNFSDRAQGKVMRDFGGMPKGGKRKTLITELPDNREDMYTDVVRFPKAVKTWKPSDDILADAIHNEELKIRLPSCEYCPVNMEWMWERMVTKCEWEPSQYPNLCKYCGAIYEVEPEKRLR